MLCKKLGMHCLLAAAAALAFPTAWSQDNTTNDDRPPPPPGGRHGGPGFGPKFADMDTNSDGGLSLEEFSAAWDARTKEQFARMDEDQDGALSEAELAKRPGPPRGRGPEGAGHGGPEGHGGAPHGDRPPAPSGQRGAGPGPMPPSRETLDANSDGSVTGEEFTDAWSTAVEEHFAKLDANDDGSLTEEEMPKRPGPPPGRGPEGERPPR